MNLVTTNEKKKGIGALAVILCLLAVVCTGTLAYFTAKDVVINDFKIADGIKVKVVEPNWNPDEAVNLLPTQTVTKDPAIQNPNDIPVYVTAEVTLPTKDIVTAELDGTPKPQQVTDLFNYEVNDKWVLDDVITGDGTVTYRYIYTEPLAPGDTTQSIFDSVTVCNYVNGQLTPDELHQQIIVVGFGIQTEGIATPEAAAAILFTQTTPKVTYAVFTASDGSLNFYKRTSMPESGNGIEVYPIDEEDCDFTDGKAPWIAHTREIKSIAVIDNGISPTSMGEWFADCESCLTIDVTKLNVERVNTFWATFAGCTSVETLDLSTWNVPSTVKTTDYMFHQMRDIATIYANDTWEAIANDTSRPTSTTFSDCQNLTGGQGTTFASKLPLFNNHQYARIDGGPSNPGYFTSKATVDLGTPDSNGVVFAVYNKAENTLNLYKRDTLPANTQVETVYPIDEANCDFGGQTPPWYTHAREIKSIAVVDDGIQPTSLGEWFIDCANAQTIDVAKLDVSKARSLYAAFSGCRTVETLDLSTWNVASDIENINSLFSNCASLTTIYANESWNSITFADPNKYDAWTYMPDTFTECRKLVGGSGTSFAENPWLFYDCFLARIDGGAENPGYFSTK